MTRTAGITIGSVDAAIKLLDQAKRMGVKTFALGDFSVTFGDSAMTTAPSGRTAYDNPFDDPDTWGHVALRKP